MTSRWGHYNTNNNTLDLLAFFGHSKMLHMLKKKTQTNKMDTITQPGLKDHLLLNRQIFLSLDLNGESDFAATQVDGAEPPDEILDRFWGVFKIET